MSTVKLSFVLRRKPELSREAFQKYWKGNHAPLVASHAKTLGILRYVQLHTTLNAETFPGRIARNAPEPYDGVAELWYDMDLATGTKEERVRATKELLGDEAKFIQLTESPLWLGVEHVIIGD